MTKTIFIVETDICTMTEEKAISLGLSREWQACEKEHRAIQRLPCTCEDTVCPACDQSIAADPAECRQHGAKMSALEELNERIVLLWNEGVNVY